ncbi:helix-turn-helix domain-containing protein [Streptomyces sp. NBC_00704]|uniref:helix-turn-helix domain-containing protein n=1 Tax=Streptomyces sp. NBC_00704 TaxID=2975809 RepID=UPI002E317D68|nr:helix-turn-helix domain-containing protein [Streptomyces sp. NBC_00704]
MLTQREAADACGASRTTIRRRREAGELPGVVLDDERGWLIPVEDLLAGFRLSASAPPDQAGPEEAPAGAGQTDVPGDAAELRAELERLRHEHELALTQEQHVRALAEAEVRHLKEPGGTRGAHR